MASSVENPPPNEEAGIDKIAELTKQQLKNRYGSGPRVLRGVHPKDHGCVEAVWTVDEDLAKEYRVGLFKHPGERLRAVIRFSNASALVTPDSFDRKPDGTTVKAHGSRGMAIKLYKVGGARLDPNDGETTQDFLMINQPIFAFSNVDDYQVLSEVIAQDDSKAIMFFARRTGATDPVTGAANSIAVRTRAGKTGGIINQIKSLTPPPPAPPPFFPYQAPPMSPLDNRYFSAAPFLFGEGRVMKFSARPVNPVSGELGTAIDDENYLRNAMKSRMDIADGKDICFDFQVQVRPFESLNSDFTDIEDMHTLWREEDYPFVTVARITIPTPQDVSSTERKEFCETLFYTPWHGLEAHLPVGGINRLRRKVYQVSAGERGCPVSPELPPLPKGAGQQGGPDKRPPPRGDGKPPPSRGRQN
ncbi:MAG TPA: hypothetical protein VEW25_06760 [Allosphingosinicella sp.]|nr:hypothetical protein [Allosphingosinicella sp.]